MKLLVVELDSGGVSQTITCNENAMIEAIRPHIYKHNFPAGKLVIEIHAQNGDVVATSDPVTIDNVSSEPFYHGYIRFYINAYLRKSTDYKIVLKGTDGYSFSESAYVGFCNSFDLQSYSATYSPNLGVNAPLDLQIWTRK